MKKILIVKEHQNDSAAMADVLRLSGYEVHISPSVAMGIKDLHRIFPDLILCDLICSHTSGYELLKSVRSSQKTELIPFIFLGSAETLAEARLSMNLGADDYLVEPIDSVDLLDTVATRLKKSRQSDAKTRTCKTGFNDEAEGSKVLDQMSSDRELRRYSRREMIFSAGDQIRYFYVIKMGRVKVFKSNSTGKELVTDIFRAGDFFGVEALVFEMPSTTNAMALENSQLLLIPRDAFIETLQEDPYFASMILKQLATSIQHKEKRMLSIAYDSVRKRIAQTLLNLSESKQNEGVRLLREDISNMVGTAKESVSRILSEFRADNIIEISAGRINILQRDKLANIMN